jgi:hypothetical protein
MRVLKFENCCSGFTMEFPVLFLKSHQHCHSLFEQVTNCCNLPIMFTKVLFCCHLAAFFFAFAFAQRVFAAFLALAARCWSVNEAKPFGTFARPPRDPISDRYVRMGSSFSSFISFTISGLKIYLQVSVKGACMC